MKLVLDSKDIDIIHDNKIYNLYDIMNNILGIKNNNDIVDTLLEEEKKNLDNSLGEYMDYLIFKAAQEKF